MNINLFGTPALVTYRITFDDGGTIDVEAKSFFDARVQAEKVGHGMRILFISLIQPTKAS